MEIETIFVEANGLTFEVNQCGSGRRLALCLHGFPELAYSWRYQLPVLANLGYRAWAPNLRGYGRSSRPPFVEDYCLEDLLDDVAGLIDAADIEEVLLLGHDWGGVIAWAFAMQRRRPLAKLVVCNAPHPFAMSREIRSWSQFCRSWYILFFQTPWLPEYLLRRNQAALIGRIFQRSCADLSRFPDEVVKVYRDNARQSGATTAMVNYYRALFRRRLSGLPSTPIDVPTLLLWGEEDVALTRATSEGLDEYVTHLTVRYLPRVSHWVQQEAPEAVNEMLRAFLAGEPVPELHWEMALVSPN